MLVFTRITKEGAKGQLGVPVTNICEITPNTEADNRCWLRYWIGDQVRSAVVEGTVEELAKRVSMLRSTRLTAKLVDAQ